MSEIEKAREALVPVYLGRYLSQGMSMPDARFMSALDIKLGEALMDAKLAEHADRIRAIAREEIKAAKSYKPQPGDAIAISDVSTRGAKLSAWTSDPNLAALICEHIDQFNALTPEQQEEHLRKQRESWVRGEMGLGLGNHRGRECDETGALIEEEGDGLDKSPASVTPTPKVDAGVSAVTTPATGASGFAIPGDPFNQEGGEANSPGRHERPATGLDKSPPAVEAPAAGTGSSGALLAASHRDGYEAGKADMTALARRLAEALHASFIWGWGGNQSLDQRSSSALAEARKHKLIE